MCSSSHVRCCRVANLRTGNERKSDMHVRKQTTFMNGRSLRHRMTVQVPSRVGPHVKAIRRLCTWTDEQLAAFSLVRDWTRVVYHRLVPERYKTVAVLEASISLLNTTFASPRLALHTLRPNATTTMASAAPVQIIYTSSRFLSIEIPILHQAC